MNRSQINETVKDFFDSWDLYKKFVDNNIMSHQEMYQAIDRVLHNRFSRREFSILDLGCGDSAFIAKVLSKYNIANYTGIDLSPAATKLAAHNLQFLQDKVFFIHCDFIQGMQAKVEHQECFDVVFTSYALHHYTLEEKQEFFNLAKKLLTPNGILIVVDVVLNESQTLKEFLAEELEFIATFPVLNSADLARAAEHVNSADIPETISTHKKLAAHAGLTQFTLICEQKFYQAFTCSNS